jgi:hypothetical protein
MLIQCTKDQINYQTRAREHQEPATESVAARISTSAAALGSSILNATGTPAERAWDVW